MDFNRLKIVLAEKKRTGKWLAEKLNKNEATVSRWCTNESQPSIETLFAIAQVLDVEVRELLISTKK
jgi:transcriptional regulator with XRE-family HTH domain